MQTQDEKPLTPDVCSTFKCPKSIPVVVCRSHKWNDSWNKQPSTSMFDLKMQPFVYSQMLLLGLTCNIYLYSLLASQKCQRLCLSFGNLRHNTHTSMDPESLKENYVFEEKQQQTKSDRIWEDGIIFHSMFGHLPCDPLIERDSWSLLFWTSSSIYQWSLRQNYSPSHMKMVSNMSKFCLPTSCEARYENKQEKNIEMGRADIRIFVVYVRLT